MIGSVKEWKKAKCAKTDDTEHLQAIETLSSLLEGETTPADAAQSITTAYAVSLKATKGGSDYNSWYETKVATFWASYMSDAIAYFGSAVVQDQLICLLVEISKVPDLKDDDGVVIKNIHHQTFWSDLPGWDRQFVSAGLCK
jgi:hypothetical protein